MITGRTPIRPSQLGIQRLRGVVVDSYDNKRVAEVLSSLRLVHPNMLIVGSGIHAQRALDEVRPTLRAPVASWSPMEAPRVPSIAFQTLIVREIECLTVSQQAELAALLSRRAGDVQVISIARLPLFPLVTEGSFRDDLYYQLNVVLLEFPGEAR